MQIPWKEYVFTTCSTSSIFTCKWSTVQLILLPVVRLVRWHPLSVVPLLQTVRCPGPLDPAASSFLPPTNDITDTGDARNFPLCKNGAALFSSSCVCVLPQNLKAQVVVFDPKTSMRWVQGEDSPSLGTGAHARPRGVAPLLSTTDCVWNGGDMHATPKTAQRELFVPTSWAADRPNPPCFHSRSQVNRFISVSNATSASLPLPCLSYTRNYDACNAACRYWCCSTCSRTYISFSRGTPPLRVMGRIFRTLPFHSFHERRLTW